jgi:lipopolysaccharide export system protein LptC
MGRGIAYIILLAGLAAASTWFLFSVQSSLQENQVQDDESPILTINGFHATSMNELGQREYVLTAPRLIQLPGEKGTVIEQPYFEIFRDGDIQDWTMLADQGWIAPERDLIRLQDEVALIRPQINDRLPLTITTRNVLIRPEEKVVETIEPVHMKTPNGVVNAIGLKSIFNQKQLDLLSTVRGSYEPPKP